MYTLLQEGRQILLGNPQHRKTVPGRKTEVTDSEWLADLLRPGLLQASCIPPHPVRDLRALPRYRTTLVHERAQEVTRVHKVLARAHVQLAAVVTAVLGVSGRALLEALLGGQHDPVALAAVARGRLRATLPALRLALQGRGRPVHLVQLRVLLAHSEVLDGALAELQSEIGRLLGPFVEAVALAQTLPGVGATAAVALRAELGTDMERFPTHRHVASWAGVCPGNTQRGGKRLSGATTQGNSWLQAILGEVAWARAHTSANDLSAQVHRLARRRGKQQAVVAVAHTVLSMLYHLLRDHRPYSDLGADYFAQLDRQHLQRHHIRRLEQLGYTVTLTPLSVA